MRGRRSNSATAARRISRGRRPGALSDEDWADFLYLRTNPKGVHAERWRHIHRLRPLLQLPARHGQRQDRRHLQDGRAAPDVRRCDGPAMSQPFRTPAGGRIDRARPLAFSFDGVAYQGLPATRSPRRCSPMAFIWSGARSSITGRAASCRAGAEEPNALVDDRSRRRAVTPNLRATQVELYDGLRALRARTAGPRSPSTSARSTICLSPLLRRRLLLQDLHVARTLRQAGPGRMSMSRRSARAAGLGARRATPDPDRYLQHYAHCDVLVVGARPGRACRRAGGERERRARHPLRRAGGASAARCSPRRAPRSTAMPARDWLARRGRDACAIAPNVRLLPRTTAFGCYAENFVGLVERVTEHSTDRRSATCRASGCGRCARARWCLPPARSSGRWCSRTTTGRASCWPTPRGAICSRYGVKVGARVVVATVARQRLSRRARPASKRASTSRSSPICARDANGPLSEAARAAGLEVAAGAEIAGVDGRLRVKSRAHHGIRVESGRSPATRC